MTIEEKKRDWIDVLEAISKFIAAVIIPVVIVVVSQSFTTAQVENQTRSEYIKMGVGLLALEPNESNLEVRRWAINLINHYSDVKLTVEAEKELEESSFLLALFGQEAIKEKQIELSWNDDGSSGYEVEIQTFDGSKWEHNGGICVSDTSTLMSVPLNQKSRWRVGSIKEDETTFSQWQDIQ